MILTYCKYFNTKPGKCHSLKTECILLSEVSLKKQNKTVVAGQWWITPVISALMGSIERSIVYICGQPEPPSDSLTQKTMKQHKKKGYKKKNH
jgi:hypothetical protein